MGHLWIPPNNHSLNREELKVSRGKGLYSSGLPFTGANKLYILGRNVNYILGRNANVVCKKKISDSEEYAGRRRS
jgi:hypothetical protein